ncbi:MAG: laccase domain-containing protein, partial [Bdellovibrionales bacterium]
SLSTDMWSEWIESGWLVDLNVLLLDQLVSLGIQADQIKWLNLDTKSDLRFHSHRRDRELSGRQISFIARL